MLLYTSVFFAIVACVCGSDVLDLEDSTFDAEVKRHDVVLVEFFAPWCGHCKRLAPEFETAATELKKSGSPVALAKVDCTEKGKEKCSALGVSGYPTLKIFRNGQFFKDYDGPRDSTGIVSYMSKQGGPSSKEIVDFEGMSKILEDKEIVLFGFFSADDDLKTAFMKTADDRRDSFKFAHTTNPDIMEKFEHKDEVVLFRPYHMKTKLESPKEVYTGSADDFYIKKFLKAKAQGLVGHRKPTNEDQFNKPLCVVYFMVDYTKNPKGTNYWRNRIMKSALSFEDKVLNYAISSKSDYARDMESFGFDGSKDEPQAAITNEVGDKFIMKEKFSATSFKQFLQDYFDGNIKPYIKSEAVPESNDGPVKVVVGQTFKEIVNDQTKDVLIEFYAPWCGHCKTLEPKFVELGEKLSSVKDIVIAKMDATANDVPASFKVEGFPTLYWAPMNGKNNPEKYSGGREVTDFIDFLKSKATNTFTLDKKPSKEEL